MARTELINYEVFEVVSPKTKKARDIISHVNYFLNNYGRRGIYDAYNRPSITKLEIYESWVKFFDEIGVYNVSVLGANSHFFSIGAIDNETGYTYYITPSHNYVVKGAI